jgi:hypothetical protein
MAATTPKMVVSSSIKINITITILDIIRCPVLYLKQNVSETGMIREERGSIYWAK